MKLGRAILLGLALATGASAPVFSATIRSVPGRGGHVIIQLTGMIAGGDADVFINAVTQANAAGRSIESVQLNSAGGKLGEGARIAAAIKFARLSTVVASDAVCASACFLAFAAGDQKFAGRRALIGVHKASDKGGLETTASGTATVLMARLAKELGVPSSILDRMLTTSPRQIAWLDPRDLRAMNVKTVDTVAQSAQIAERTRAQQDSAAATVPMPSSAKPASNRPPWNEFIEKAIALSAEQNHGSAMLRRACKPEPKECVMAVAFLLPDGRPALATAVQDASGNITRREVCESNASNDVRDCVDWDTGAKFRDFKDTKGDWVQSTTER